MPRLHPALIAFLAVIVLPGCGDDAPTGPPSVTIPLEGGTVTSSDGRATLAIPAGALAAPTAITITPAAASADPRILPGTEYVFEPDGLRFAVPARLAIRFDSIPAAFADQADYIWLHRRTAGGWTPMIGQPIDRAGRTIRGEITGFSSYGGATSSLADDLLTAGLQLQALLTDAIATEAIALLGTLGAILQNQNDPAFQMLAQPVLDAAGTTACNAYRTAVNTARNSPVDDWGVLTGLLEPVSAWAAIAAKLGALDGCPATLAFEQIFDLKIQQFVSFYTAKLDPAAFGQNFDRLVQEVQAVTGMRGTVFQLGFADADQKLLHDAQHPLMDELRRAAYTACRSDGRHEYLGRLRIDVAGATYTDEQLLDDLQQCGTVLTWSVVHDDLTVNGTGTLGGGPTPGTQNVEAATPGLAQGSFSFGGDVRAFMCPGGGFAPDELVVTLDGVEVHRRSHTGGLFFGSPLQLDAETILQTAGVDPGANVQVPLVAARESSGCNQYVQSTDAVTLATLLLQYPAPQVVYENDFSSAAGPAWGFQSLATSPSGEQFLGVLANGAMGLSLTGLPTHTRLEVAFDLYIIRTWGGNNTSFGPDFVSFRLDGATLLTTTFSNEVDRMQSYPEPHPVGNHPAGTGAAAINTLGYPAGNDDDYGDSIYRLVFEVDHVAGTVAFQILASNLQPLPDEFWGVDNVRVTVR